MDGLWFYWIAWMIWIYATFIMKRDSKRTYIALWMLLLLIFSDSEAILGGVHVNLAIFSLYIGGIIYLSTLTRWFTNIFRSLCLVFGYVGVLFWEQISPIWMFAPRLILIALLGFIVLFLLSKNYLERCVIWCLGVTSGEIIHGLILSGYGFQEQIGDLAFLDLLFIELAVLTIFELVKELKTKIDLTIQTVEKQKRGWTHE